MRTEIEFALRERLRLIPVLVRDAAQPDAATLPKSLRAFADRQYLTMNGRSADRDLEYLMDQLREVGPASNEAKSAFPEHGGVQINGGRIRGDVFGGSKTVINHGR